MSVTWHHLFIPHRKTHEKAKLLSWEALVIYILLFIFLQAGFSVVSYYKPGVLGINGNIDQKKIIELTNKQREKLDLPTLSENAALNKAAEAKAANMFSENYWAHFAPSGRSPWDFILGMGYKFTFAGENLAKNFYDSESVVAAWMESPSHKENIVNPKYNDIGIAVVEGILDGQKTTLVVQMFGTTSVLAAANTGGSASVDVGGEKIEVQPEEIESKPQIISQTNRPTYTSKSLVDPFQLSKTLGFGLIAFITLLLILDLVILKVRGVFRISSHHIAHLSVLSASGIMLFMMQSGSIL